MVSFKCILISIIILIYTRHKNCLICMCVYFKEMDFIKICFEPMKYMVHLQKSVAVVEFQLFKSLSTMKTFNLIDLIKR